jgi:urea transport system substrate-binding protein
MEIRMKPTPTEAPCPHHDELSRLLLGNLPEAEAARLQDHVHGCEKCRQTLESLQAATIAPPTPPLLNPASDTNAGDLGQQSSIPAITWTSSFMPIGPGDDRAVTPSFDPCVSTPSSFSFLSPPREASEIGWLGDYSITALLGQGGMGFVFDAFDTHLHRRVALKVLKPELAADASFRERFVQEARAAAALPDEYIITIYRVGVENNVPYLAMKFLHGESLEQRLQNDDRLLLHEVLRIGREIALGLSAAHERGLIHRDIKPANLWLETPPPEEGGPSGSRLSCEFLYRVKILDFGLARPINDTRRLTATGLIVGTPSYLAPEQARGLPLDHRCDLFSLGCVLYRMVTGILPFDGPNTMAQLTALAVDDPQPIEQLAPDVPAGLRQLIHQLLARNPDERPATARAVAESLRALEKGEIPSRAAVTQPLLPLESTGRPGRSSRFKWLTAAVVLCALSIVGGILLMNLPRKTAAEDPGAVVPPSGDPIKVGVLFSQKGTMANTGMPATDVALLALDEINDNGGLLGRPVQAVVRDGKSINSQFSELAEQLIVEEHVCTIIGCRTSASRKTVLPIVEKHDNLLLYPMQFEGLEQSPNIVYLGAAPNQQILPAVRYAVRMMDQPKHRVFLIGSDYVFPRAANAIIRDALAGEPGVQIVGEYYLPFGSGTVDKAIAAIVDKKPDLILNTINGDTNAPFFRALRQAGITAGSTPVLSFSIAENDLRSLDDRDIVGHLAAWNYFQSLDNPANSEFIRKFRERYGPERVLSDPMEAVYFGVQLWAQAVRQAGSVEPSAIRAAIKDQSCLAPEGPVRIDPDTQYTWKEARLGRIVSGGQFKKIWSSDKPIRPEPFPPSRSRKEWLHFLDDMSKWWGGNWQPPHS